METSTTFKQLFKTGGTFSTPGAIDAYCQKYGVDGWLAPIQNLITRHVCGDDGDLTEDDKEANREAVKSGDRIVSAYQLDPDTRILIITEAVGDDGERASTCILLPEEY